MRSNGLTGVLKGYVYSGKEEGRGKADSNGRSLLHLSYFPVGSSLGRG